MTFSLIVLVRMNPYPECDESRSCVVRSDLCEDVEEMIPFLCKCLDNMSMRDGMDVS